MQIATVLVALRGDIQNTVPKTVTPAEAAVLMVTHDSQDSVTIIEITGEIKRPAAQEIDRLSRAYGNDAVRSLFPGLNPTLPDKFEDIGLLPNPGAAMPEKKAESVPVLPAVRRRVSAAGAGKETGATGAAGAPEKGAEETQEVGGEAGGEQAEPGAE